MISPQMFHSSSEAEYSEKLEEYSRTWGSAFHQYYIEEIHPYWAKTCRWALEPLGVICNPYSGVTNNQSESFNRVIKDFQSWKEAPLDSFVLALDSFVLAFVPCSYKHTMEMR